MDGLAEYEVAGVRQHIESTGARLLYLPPYSPDFNPIEKCWHRLSDISARPIRDRLPPSNKPCHPP